MGRSPCCSKEGLNRGAWTAHEDKILKDYIRVHGEGRWRNLPKKAGLKRCGKSCRLRWLNYLRPDIKRGNISPDEEELIIRLHKLLGNRWSLIAGRLPGRTDNEIKNYWNTNLSKKVKARNQASASYRRRSALQPNGKISEHPKPQTQSAPKDKVITPSPSTSPSPSPSPPKTDTHVFRTKATKCSKVLLIHPPLPHHSPMQLQFKSNAEAEEETIRPLHVDAVAKANDSIINQMEPGVYDNNGFLSFLIEDHKELSTDLLADYSVGDVCLSDLLNSDFSNVCDFSYSNNNKDELLSPCSDQPPVFSDEILKDWTHSNFADDTNVSNNLHLLESSEE